MSTSVAGTPAQGLQRWMILASGVGGSLIIVMGLSGAGIALPHMQGAFSAAPDQIAWVLTSFIVSSTLTMACSGWLSDRFGRRRIYLLSIAGFTIASALCGIADTLAEEVLYRTLQGAFGGPLLPLGQVIAVDPFPREKQGFATSMWGMGAMWGTVFGSLSGGYLVDHLSWSWVFFINVPLGAVAFLCAWAYVPETVQSRGRPLDWMGFVALCLGGLRISVDAEPGRAPRLVRVAGDHPRDRDRRLCVLHFRRAQFHSASALLRAPLVRGP